MNNVTVIKHPLIQQGLTRLRDKRTQPQEFRRALDDISTLMIYEATRSLEVIGVPVETPLEATQGFQLAHEILLVPILRAGLGMLAPLLELLPNSRVGFVGLKRDETTLRPVAYHQSLPPDLGGFEIIVVDPMLATGGSAVAALDLLVEKGAKHLRLVNLVASPEGINMVQKRHPEVPIFTATVDRQINERGFILPGLGDAGDRLFGT